MTDHPIHKYIKEAKQQGMSNEQIIAALTNAGWRVEQIFDIVMQHISPSAPAADKASMISVRGISKFYDKNKALDNVSLEVKKGKVTSLLGPHAAGKTPLVRILTTLLAQTSATAAVAAGDGVDGRRTVG